MTLHSFMEMCKRGNRKYYHRGQVLIVLRWHDALNVEKAAETLRDRLIIRLALFVGMRAHEITDASIEDFDFINGWVLISHGHFAGPRFAAVDDKTLLLIQDYVGQRKHGPLITRRNGQPISRFIVYYVIRKAGKKSGFRSLGTIGPNVLKRAFATEWLRKKGNIRLLQKQLGHVHLESTAHYLMFLPEEVKAEHSRLFGQFLAVQAWRERVE